MCKICQATKDLHTTVASTPYYSLDTPRHASTRLDTPRHGLDTQPRHLDTYGAWSHLDTTLDTASTRPRHSLDSLDTSTAKAQCRPSSVARATRCRTVRRSALIIHAPWPRLAAGAMASVESLSRIEKVSSRVFLQCRHSNMTVISMHAAAGLFDTELRLHAPDGGNAT